MPRSDPPRIAILAPIPILTVTIETGDEQGPEMHYHPGGQGIWVARMAVGLGAEVTVCAALAGESGSVIEGLVEQSGIDLRAVAAHGRSGSYIHDRRSGERVLVAETDGPRLWRHESDELYGVTLTAGLDAELTMLTGSQPHEALPADFFRRLAADLRANGATVIADVSHQHLEGTLEGGVDLVKISHEQLIESGLADSAEREALVRGMRELRSRGADDVVLSCAGDPTLALIGEDAWVLEGPILEPSDPRGAGDSMFAGIGVALANGSSRLDAVRLGMAAGALNVTRRGLGTGGSAEIERLMTHVRARPLDSASEAGDRGAEGARSDRGAA